MENKLQKASNNQIAEKNITDKVANQVKELVNTNRLVLPKHYAVDNALKSAFLELSANNLLNTDQTALAKALLDMCIQGLTPAKKQCYFINYGGKVSLFRSYHGDRAVAKITGIVKDIQAYIIYDGDVVNISYSDIDNRLIVEHKTDFKNWNNEPVGAYAVAIMPDGSKQYDLMTLERIKKSWAMSSNKSNNKLQQNFNTDAMQRTVTRHLVKNLFNQTNDDNLVIDNVLQNNQENELVEENQDLKFDEEQVINAQVNDTASIKVDVETGELEVDEETPNEKQVSNAFKEFINEKEESPAPASNKPDWI